MAPGETWGISVHQDRPSKETAMKLTPSVLAVSITLLATSVAFPSPASAEERVCRGTIGAQTVDNLRVP